LALPIEAVRAPASILSLRAWQAPGFVYSILKVVSQARSITVGFFRMPVEVRSGRSFWITNGDVSGS
jgi:hypothetical protein